MHYKKLSILFLVFFILFACKKDLGVIENVQVINFTDFSIKTDANIIDFEIIDTNLFFAVGQFKTSPYFEIYKTIDGGKNWTTIDFNPTSLMPNISNFDYTSFGFTNENNGVIVLNKLCFRTFNGGLSWNEVKPFVPNGNQVWYFNYAGRSGQNEFIFSESDGIYNKKETILSSKSNINTYNFLNYRYNYGVEFNKGKVTNGKLIFFTDDFNYWEDFCLSYDILNNSFDTLYKNYYGGLVTDAYYSPTENIYYASIDEGYLTSYMKDPYDLIYHPNTFFGNPLYQYHTRPYNSIEKLDDYFVAVGEETFATNKSGTWNEVITNKGTGQKVNYNKIKKLTGNQFVVSGNNGFFKKGILK